MERLWQPQQPGLPGVVCGRGCLASVAAEQHGCPSRPAGPVCILPPPTRNSHGGRGRTVPGLCLVVPVLVKVCPRLGATSSERGWETPRTKRREFKPLCLNTLVQWKSCNLETPPQTPLVSCGFQNPPSLPLPAPSGTSLLPPWLQRNVLRARCLP